MRLVRRRRVELERLELDVARAIRARADLRDRRVLIFLDDLKGTRCRLDDLARVAKECFLASKSLFFRGIESRRRDLVDLIAQEVESQCAISLRLLHRLQLICRTLPCVIRGSRGIEQI